MLWSAPTSPDMLFFFTQEPEEAQEEEAHANKLRANSVKEKYVWNISHP